MKKTTIDKQYMSALSLVLQQKRVELGISQDELAEKANLHRTYVSLIERKSCNFSMKVFIRLAEGLKLEPAELMIEASALIKSKRKRAA